MRLLNIIYLVTTVWSFSLLGNSLIRGNEAQILTIGLNFSYKTICFLLNIYGRQYLAWLLLAFGFSIGITWFWICIDSAWDPVFIHLIIIFLILIIFKGVQQILLLIFVCLMYLGAPIIAPYVPEIYINQIETYPNVTTYSFVFYIILSGVLLTFYQMETKKYRKIQAKIIQNLQDSNNELNEIKEELGQFTNAVSVELKKQIHIVKEENQKIDEALSLKNNFMITEALQNSNDAAQEMYHLVKDELE